MSNAPDSIRQPAGERSNEAIVGPSPGDSANQRSPARQDSEAKEDPQAFDPNKICLYREGIEAAKQAGKLSNSE
ncbi:peptidase m12a astacin [Moniliophthora roreri]|nr:peptidase m12a astacin [Moniliophthora roreri]